MPPPAGPEPRDIGARMKAMILAAGEGTRLGPLTTDRPKPMLPVAGRCLLEYTVAWLRHHGVRRIAINLHHRGEVIAEHFGDGADFGVEVTYSREEALLGTAGGAKRLEAFLDEPFVLVYGDVLTDLDLTALIRFHRAQPPGERLTMALYSVPNPTDCGIVRLDDRGRVVEFVEKPPPDAVFSDLANAGILVVEPEILAHVPGERFFDFGRDVFPLLAERAVPMYGWPLPTEAYLIDIGSHEKYVEAQRRWPTAAARAFLEPRETTP